VQRNERVQFTGHAECSYERVAVGRFIGREVKSAFDAVEIFDVRLV